MAAWWPFARRAQAPNSARNDINEVGRAGSRGMRAALSIAAALLVFSSAGFGMTFAWHQGAHHGPALAMLAVCMALGLEVVKPFAVEAVFDSMRRLAVGRALAMLALAVVAIGYSLTAELSLMATTRADAAAGRESALDVRRKAAERYQRAAAELSTLAPSRPSSELQALLAGKDCGRPIGPKVRELCAELGRAERRTELEAALSKAEADSAARPSLGAGDAGAAALSTVLALFGLAVPAAVLAPWLVLVGVLALEVGSSLAVVLMRSVSTLVRQSRPLTTAVDSPATATPKPAKAVHAPRAAPRRAERGRVRAKGTRNAAADKIVDTLQANGGRAPSASVRQLGAMLGERKSTVHNAVAMLVASGVIERVGRELVLRG
jgi:ABC-type multidrug transport system fused ATPase/permease subunit